MKLEANTVEEYLEQVPEERQVYFNQLRKVILENIPDGFSEQILYGMPACVVPRSLYPNGYHVKPELLLPFVNIASQKNFIALYHMGIYANPAVLAWFVEEYPKHCKYKLDMGKSCIRFKKMKDIPYQLIGELMQKMTVQNWIEIYERQTKKL